MLTQPEQALLALWNSNSTGLALWNTHYSIGLAHLRLDGDDNAEITALGPGAGNVSWGQLRDAALRHGVAPLLYLQLKERGADDIPDPLLRSLEEQYFASLARSTLIYHELGAILELFRSEGLQVILLKGAALAGTVYPNIALRPMGDVDLLIRVPDLPRVQEMLITQGYAFYPDRAREFDRSFGRAKMFTRQTPYPLSIDLHWRLLEWPRGQPATLLTEWLWGRAVERRVAGIPALVLSPEAQILHLTSHLAKHRWQRLLWFHDIAQVLQYYEEERLVL